MSDITTFLKSKDFEKLGPATTANILRISIVMRISIKVIPRIFFIVSIPLPKHFALIALPLYRNVISYNVLCYFYKCYCLYLKKITIHFSLIKFDNLFVLITKFSTKCVELLFFSTKLLILLVF